ncbi:hypothetical protein DL546_007490 [Coniochaeta pulveracea]|uniref:DUF1479 domain protein n=1 Tax=Coniochaeta pulveracea TaxID=177199 RepID=A0A420YKA0_9PEZI|nr:hypothetical protein DL546_007490 [Coniochaeta pulveracea]
MSLVTSVQREPIALQPRFGEIKRRIMASNPSALVDAWQRLLRELKNELEIVAASASSELIPSIQFEDISSPFAGPLREEFSHKLRHRGVAVIRGVITMEMSQEWREDVVEYLAVNPRTQVSTAHHIDQRHHLYELFWSPTQIQARAHPNVLAAQKFAMSHWDCHPHTPSTASASTSLVSTSFPISYADRILVQNSAPSALATAISHVDNGSVERWETDGYGRAGTYKRIFAGDWEEHDPWDATARANAAPDLYGGLGRCSIFRMFQGWLGLGGSDPNHQTSILHGALPSYTQEINDVLHPHLDLSNSLISTPPLNPGDYLIWHPDTIHSVSGGNSTMLYLPAVPLTQTNALYLARQRKAFLLGHPGPDFGGGGSRGSGESDHVGRPGVQEVSDAGDDEALRAMGLLPFDEDDAETEGEKSVLNMVNGILFPDRFGMV